MITKSKTNVKQGMLENVMRQFNHAVDVKQEHSPINSDILL